MPSMHSEFRYTETDSGCWQWAGHMDKNGYGRIYDAQRKRIEWAHRYSYSRHKGSIPERHEIDHTCQNTACVNPAHLDAVTKREHARRTMQRLGKDDLHLAAARLRQSGLTYAEISEALNFEGRASAFGAINAAIEKGLVDADDVPRGRFISDEDQRDMQFLRAVGVPIRAIAAWYGLHESQVSRVSRGISSGHSRRAT